MSVASTLRLPGVYFLSPPPTTDVDLPPLDVAAFVGFAERGPLHLPTPVTDIHTYQAIFGDDLPLARHAGGDLHYANLPRTVANFFANGGRRCYVVRVAGPRAHPTQLAVPALVALTAGGQANRAALTSSSVGQWATRLQLATRLQRTPLPWTAFAVNGPQALTWQLGSAPDAIQPGDLLRLTLSEMASPVQGGSQWLFPVTAVLPPATATGVATLRAEQIWQLVTPHPAQPPRTLVQAWRLTHDRPEPLTLSGQLTSNETQLTLTVSAPATLHLERGDVLHLTWDDDSTCLFPVMSVQTLSAIDSPPMPWLALQTTELLRLPSHSLPSATIDTVERLRYDLLVRLGNERPLNLNTLAFNRSHPRFWGDVILLESSALYRQSAAQSHDLPPSTRLPETPAQQAAAFFRRLQTDQRSEAVALGQFDLAALAGLLAPLTEQATRPTYLPLGMSAVLTEQDFRGPTPAQLGDDDLAQLTPAQFAALFVDEYLVRNPFNPATNETARTLMTSAFDRYYRQNRRLHGLHSLLFVDEVALLSVTDAVQRPWAPATPVTLPPPVTPPPPTPPLSCPAPTAFAPCPTTAAASATGATNGEDTASTTATPPPRWPNLPLLQPLDAFTLEPLLAIQRALLQLCQARSDVIGILTLPQHFAKRQCLEWQQALRQQLGLPRRGRQLDALTDLADLSYVAVYHPWLLVSAASNPTQLFTMPPDGAVCGLIAARERQRQVWVAPANIALQRVLDLTPSFSHEDWAELFALQFNLVRREPRDFRLMSAHTLSDERSLLQLSVRRLLILLRKIAAQRGMDYVFESNHERFREGVRVLLEDLLRVLFGRGAFAGTLPEEAFRVVTDASVNPPQGIEQGRFIAEIRVAPAQPLEFITVLLTRTGEGQLLASEV